MPATTTPPARHPLLRRLRAELERLYGPRLDRVLLYGSRARGEAREDSDWDVAVILKDYDGSLDEHYRLADLSHDLLLETGEFLTLVPFAPEELSRRTLLMHNIRREGIPV
ncbi:MAG TPA: nucleotidyltransferase domain-containing protein [Geminicoccaceae bacterium]|nr:nucleotidyltransferase domain-containing protein [Geminicoccaceae bacterium]